MNVLVLGGGGREHALAWRVAQDSHVETVYLHPGNAGTQAGGWPTLCAQADLGAQDIAGLCKQKQIPLVVIGPEGLLESGMADALRSAGLAVFGPGVEGARLESSKAFAKEFMLAAGIPTAAYHKAETPDGVRAAISKYPTVLKLDSLAAGKGVVVAQNAQEVEGFLKRVWNSSEFGAGKKSVVVEEFLQGRELSYIGLCDGHTFVPLSSASDYKRVGEGNTGPNTGGMGCISPSPVLSAELEERIQKQIIEPCLRQMRTRRMDYRGALYFGLMISPDQEPYVLEFNARFGDPETQALVLRLQGDFAANLLCTAEGRLDQAPVLDWTDDVAVYVVGAAEGYPSAPRTGDPIEGLDLAALPEGVFFSGVAAGESPTGLVTRGGRVLGVGARGPDAAMSRKRAYALLETIRWKGKHLRRDIGL